MMNLLKLSFQIRRIDNVGGRQETVDIIVLNAEIERIVARGDVLRREISAIIAEIEGEKANG
jgi:hypothetical protein